MKPVDQAFLHAPPFGDIGDCFAACLASILDMDRAQVPHFVTTQGPEQPGAGPVWWAATRRWLRSERGIDIASFDITEDFPTPCSLYVSEPGDWQQYGIGDVQSPRGDFRHAVVVNLDGTVVHDPHPSRASMGARLDGVDLLVPIDESWNPLVNPDPAPL